MGKLRFSLRTLLVAMAVVAVTLWRAPIMWREALWKQPRERLLSWEEDIDRSMPAYDISSEYVWGRRYFISTRRVLAYPVPGGSAAYDFPADAAKPPAESPFGPGEGYFITPQYTWVESIDDAIDTWQATTEEDWRRYEALRPQ
ncbi:MAG: hypothetical protein AAGJ46_01015 [Planctomycetota bacterium]